MRILAVLAALLLAGQAFTAPPTPEQRYRAAAAEVLTHSDEFFSLDGSDAAVRALDRMWDAFEDWSLAYLRSHPKANAKELEAAAPVAETHGETPWVVELEPGLFAVTMRFANKADVYLLRRSGIAWDIRKAAPARKGLRDWSTWLATPACYNQLTKKHDGHCGPQFDYAVVSPLPRDRHGRLRFYIDADYAGNGGTRLYQFSIWRWDGQRAAPLIVKNHAAADYDEQIVTGQGDLLLVRVKQAYKTLGAYGCCAGREMDWRFKLTPDGVRDLGQTPVTPELDAVDSLIDRLWDEKPAGDLATPAVIAALNPLVAERRAEEAKEPVANREFAMLALSAVERGRAGTKLCLVLDRWTSGASRQLVFDVGPENFLKSLEIKVADPHSGCEHFTAKAP